MSVNGVNGLAAVADTMPLPESAAAVVYICDTCAVKDPVPDNDMPAFCFCCIPAMSREPSLPSEADIANIGPAVADNSPVPPKLTLALVPTATTAVKNPAII